MFRVLRGGEWYFVLDFCRNDNRNFDNRRNHTHYCGFRLTIKLWRGKVMHEDTVTTVTTIKVVMLRHVVISGSETEPEVSA